MKNVQLLRILKPNVTLVKVKKSAADKQFPPKMGVLSVRVKWDQYCLV